MPLLDEIVELLVRVLAQGELDDALRRHALDSIDQLVESGGFGVIDGIAAADR